jgi:hypothetical protein
MEWCTSRLLKVFGAYPVTKHSNASNSNIGLLLERLKDVPEEFHGAIAWYLLGSLSGDIDSDDWEDEVDNAIRYARGL